MQTQIVTPVLKNATPFSRTPQKIIKKNPPPPQLKLCCGSFPFFVYL